MTCPDCKREGVIVERTNDNGDSVSRRRKCVPCGATWWTDERIRRGSLLRITAQGYAAVDTGSQGTAPVRPGDLGGLDLSGSLSVANPAPSEPQVQTPARVKRQRVYVEPKYTPEFELLWEGCDRVGTKSEAFAAWEQVGKPDPAEVVATWKRYRDSIGEQHPKHVSSWLRAFGHKQEWVPLHTDRRPVRVQQPVVSFAVREEAQRKARQLDRRFEAAGGK